MIKIKKLLALILISCCSTIIYAQCVDKSIQGGEVFNSSILERNKKFLLQENVKIGISEQSNGYQVVWNFGGDCFYFEGLNFVTEVPNVDIDSYVYSGSLTLRSKNGNESNLDVTVVSMMKKLDDLVKCKFADKGIIILIFIPEIEWEIVITLEQKI